MKIKDGFVLRTIVNEHVVTGEGLERVNFNKIVVLNDTAAYLWEKALGQDFEAEDLAAWLQEAYEVDAETALKDAAATLQSWQEIGLVD